MAPKRILSAIVVAFGLQFVFVVVAWALPPVPMSIIGIAQVNGTSVPTGTVIVASCADYQAGMTSTFDYSGSSYFSLDVYGDDLTTPTREGCRDIEAVSFTIEGLPADQTLTWYSGVTVGTWSSPFLVSVTPTPTPTNTPTSTPTGTPTPTSTPTDTPTPTSTPTGSGDPGTWQVRPAA